MTWFVKSKVNGQSNMEGSYWTPTPMRVAAQNAGAAASYETPLFGATDLTIMKGLPGPGTNIGSYVPFSGDLNRYLILGAYIVPITTITGGDSTHNATASILLYDSTGTVVGTLFSKAYTTGNNATALAFNSLGSPSTTVRNNASKDACLIRKNETLTFKWVQSATTGLALPDAIVVLDIV